MADLNSIARLVQNSQLYKFIVMQFWHKNQVVQSYR